MIRSATGSSQHTKGYNQMNYIKELNAIYDYCISKHLSKSEVLLLHVLYMINNKSNWKDWFEADNILLQRLTGGLSRESINRARNRLKQIGRIDFQTGQKNKQPPKYKIIPFESDIKVDIQVDKQVDILVDKEADIQVDHFNKLKQNKTKRNEEKENNKRKRNFGSSQNVFFTEEEYEKLKSEFPKDYQDWIERLSGYMASTGKQYKNHLATIRIWSRRDKQKSGARETAAASNASYDIEALDRRGFDIPVYSKGEKQK